MSRESVKDLEELKNSHEIFPHLNIDRVSKDIRDNLRRLTKTLRELSLQLYIQFMLQTDLIHRTLRHALLYYVQRDPEELGKFQWIVDAKQKGQATSVEHWWEEILKPFLATLSIQEPHVVLEGADYKYLDKFRVPLSEWDPRLPGQSNEGTDLKQIFADFKYNDGINFGLELVDILTNAVRRALMNNL